MKETNEYAVINRYREAIPVAVQELCGELGVRVHTAYLDPDISGMLESKGHGKYLIIVNASDRATRQRFTVAHELGHYILHRSLIGDGIDDDRRLSQHGTKGSITIQTSAPREETEANKFAADVLMPWALIKRFKDTYNGPPEDLASTLATKFQVSLQAMTIRLS